MAHVVDSFRRGFGPGYTAVTTYEEADPTGIAFGVLNLAAGESWERTLTEETALLLMSGEVSVTAGDIAARFARASLFDEPPRCVHGASGTVLRLTAHAASELTVYATRNTRRFAPRVFTETPDEHRGAGQVGGRCLRLVRTIFDRNNSPPEAELVLGEVITLPGGWSSYPPHHHPQPEIYHYRFTHQQGYGHAELGERVVKVRANDTIKIPAGHDHAQCAAPGYGMYYAWVIRHLPQAPYTVPEFTAEHRWTLQPGAPYWRPKNPGSST
jgi:5-deoxy-glucuronate isomerase